MLEDLKLSHLQFAFVVLILLVIVGGIYFYSDLINRAQRLTRENYECDSVGSLRTINQSITNRSQARQYVASYLQERNISVSASSLTAFAQEDRYRVTVPEALYNGETCTWRRNGTQPPQCLGKWFDITNGRLLMQYEVPC
ncbi:MAG: hypothetical protein SV186_00685 [Candidatus Nanohaloarchaea archaeon]|nr:hypothetical protein [Candidatus Nanohaloarchaea archaeon]